MVFWLISAESVQYVCRYDAVVVGLGGMGSSALYHLAKRKQKVIPLSYWCRHEELLVRYMARPAGFTQVITPLSSSCNILTQLVRHQVLGLEQFSVAHDRGSSHGESRIIRLAYHEHPDYVPLLLRAYALWQELQEEAGQVRT